MAFDPDLLTLNRLVQFDTSTPDGEDTLADVGLILHNDLDRLDYWCTPTNARTFASTGGDGVHFSLVDLGNGPAETSPVVMTVPMAFGDAHEPNWIVGATLHEFLALGIDIGFFSLEQLAYQPDFPSQIESAIEAERTAVLRRLAKTLALSSWRDVADRLEELSSEFGSALAMRARDKAEPARVERPHASASNVEDARQALTDIAAQWACGLVNATEVVDTAVEALMVGLDTTSLVRLAGTTRADADVEVHELLPAAMEELRLPYFGWDHPESRLLAVAALAREHVHGRLPARDLCRIVHARFGHDAHDLIEPFAVLDDEYDTLEYFQNPTEEQIEGRVLDAARRIVASVTPPN